MAAEIRDTCPRPAPRRSHAALLLGALLLAGIVTPGPARAFNKGFAAGSLIVPAQMEYQTDCGMTSAYGLIYTILYRNAALMAAGKKPVTVYWIIEPRKLSHHRCDTSTDTLPDYSRFNDNDGCDAAIQSAAGQPVARLRTDNTEEAPFQVFSTSYDKAKGESSRTSPTPGTTIGAGKKVVKYSGSFWVIDAADRAVVLDMLNNDPLVGKFRDGGSCNSIPVATNGSHHTEIHSARIGFTAPVARMINVKPPLIALLDAGAVTILQAYLKNAGLADLPNAGGTTTTHGVIYDTLDPVTDFVSTPTYPRGALNMPDPVDATRTYYQVVWAPHWVADGQSTLPKDNDPGDDQPGDGTWTHRDPVTGTYDDPITNALKNIGAFADAGNGVFAECASIESFEGSYSQGSPSCSGTFQCQCTNNTYCTVGDIQPLTCSPGYTNACDACYQCPAGYTLDASVCNEVKCVESANPCPVDYTYSCGTCNACDAGWILDTSGCPSQPAVCRSGGKKVAPNTAPLNTAALSTAPLTCSFLGYSQTCIPSPASIDIPGNDATRFHATNRLQKNGLGNSFSGPDCTDQYVVGSKYKTSTLNGDCLDFHPTTGGPATIFSQKGNFNYTGTSGHIHQYLPPPSVGSFYRPGVLKFATSRNKSDASRDGWDFTTARHKDDDPAKGMVVYLAGHSYQNDVAGNRIVLNTMLNLGFSDAGVEIARSEPVGYVTRNYQPDGTFTVAAETVFQGTYIQRPPPGTFQDWINYNAALPKSWKFPYTDGHLRAYDLGSISTTKQDFSANSTWNASTRLPLPANRQIYTALGGRGRAGWSKVEMRYTETNPATCRSSRNDATGNPICDLSWELAECATAGVTQAGLQAGDPTGSWRKLLGMFVQQVRGHCSAHDKITGNPIYAPTDAQCDDIKQQKNRAKLGGIDHSSPAIVGPSRYIPDEVSAGVTIEWSKRPVIAYAGGRDGMLHAFYVSGDTGWKADGATLPAGVQAGQEIWAFVPPGQLCGLHTNTAMVDATMNVVDAFGKFPRDRNGDGTIDWSDPAERPTGIRTWRTVLVASVGEGGSELFAFDVTNPLRPVLLWHVGGPSDKDNDWFDPVAAAWKPMDKGNPLSYALKWYNWDDGAAATKHIPTPYNTTDPTILDAIKTGRFDYRNMGLAFGTAVGMLWEGNAFRYVVLATSSSADWTNAATPLGYRGIETFAIDLVSGEKLWQWQNRYMRANAAGTVIADNAVPGRPALLDVNGDGALDRVYVGDIEGRLWELSAADGKNYNYLKDASTSKFVSLPLFGAPPMSGAAADPTIVDSFKPVGSASLALQPLTSPIGIGRMLQVPSALEKYLKDRIAIAQGTMGVDWSIAPFEKGHIFVLPAYPEIMVVAFTDPVSGNTVQETVDTRDRDIDLGAKPQLALRGVLLSPAAWDIELDVGERVFGMPKIVGNDVIANTSYGGFGGDIAETYLDSGRTLRVSASGGNQTLESIGKAFGGALLMDDSVVVTSASGMARVKPANQLKGSTQTNPRNRYTPTDFTTWEQLPPELVK